MLDQIPPFWDVGDTSFARGYRPEKQAVIILATRRHGANRTAYIEQLISVEVIQYSRLSIKRLINEIELKMIKALDAFIEGETDAHTSD